MALREPPDDSRAGVAEQRDRRFRQKLLATSIPGNQRELSVPENDSQNARLKLAAQLCEAGELDDSWDIANAELIDNPNHPGYLLIASQINDKARRLTVAYQFAKRVTEVAPTIPEGWINLGRINDELYMLDEAVKCYATGLEHAKTKSQRTLLLVNMGAVAITRGDWKEAERLSRLALSLDPLNRKANGNLGTACLGQRKWVEGWAGYAHILGSDNRKLFQFADEPQWDGSPGKSIIIYGEQGLGDEICFASMFPDVIRDSRKTVIECNPKLHGLFRRSFPTASVYGTRWSKEVSWDEQDTHPDASVSSGALGGIYRKDTASFPGAPYLVADPDRIAMWQALWSTKRKPAIGLAWTGGVQWTAKKFRTWKVAELFPLIDAFDAHYVSLQYEDCAEDIDGTPIVQYGAATLTKDYDDTAALVASLDLVITMQTAVAHLAGALGVPCIVFVPDTGQWRYGTPDQESTPWYGSVRVVHQRGNWKEAKERAINLARGILGHH